MALNYYRLLGIPPDADQQRIKSVFRSMAKRFHPDANNGSEAAAELFRQIHQAYQVLSDPAARADYDRKLAREEALREKQQPGSRKTTRIDPQQKFNRFLHTLLGVILGPDEPTPPARPQARPVPREGRQQDHPAFNACYHQAMKNSASPYVKGTDGVYRKSKGPQRPPQRVSSDPKKI